jgi:cGMP-dependent 3',5'-cyclic phosphodiesterase
MRTSNATCLFAMLGTLLVWLQRHHFAQAVCMLNTEGCNILDGMPREQYTKCLDLIRDLILGKHKEGILKLKN